MTDLTLVAAGGLAREVLSVLRMTQAFDRIRVLDDDPALWGGDLGGAPVMGGLDLVTDNEPEGSLLVCAGRGVARRRLVERLTARGVDASCYATLVHPQVVVPPGCSVGPGCILMDGVVMTADVRVGAHVVAMPHVTLTHDVLVEDFATLCAGVSLGGGVCVGEAAYLGMNAAVREGLRVGREATLGMGAALVRDLPPAETWTGVPARPVRSHQEVVAR